MDRTLTHTIVPVQSVPGSNGNVRFLDITQATLAGASPSDNFALFKGHLLKERCLTSQQNGSRRIVQPKPLGN